MTDRKSADGLDFEALRQSIERCDLDLMLGFYAEDAQLRIVNTDTPQGLPFELRGKVEIAKYLRAVFGQGASHRVEREAIGKNRVTFREACEYPDGSRVVVETRLEVPDGKIVRQVDVVAQDTRADREEEIDRRLPARKHLPETNPEVDELPTGDLS